MGVTWRRTKEIGNWKKKSAKLHNCLSTLILLTNSIFTKANYLVQINNIHNFLNIQQHIAKHNCVIVELKTFLGPQNWLCCFCLHTINFWVMRTNSLICKHENSLFLIRLSTHAHWFSIHKLFMQLSSFDIRSLI